MGNLHICLACCRGKDKKVLDIDSAGRRAFFSRLLASISTAISSSSDKDERLAAWSECGDALKELLNSRSLRLAAKALDISYDFERVYVAGRVLTSVRPVFNDDRNDIVGSTVVQTLRLEFLAPDGDQSNISVAMDMEDLRRLQEECKRAIEKARIARDRIEKDSRMEAIIPGEEN